MRSSSADEGCEQSAEPRVEVAAPRKSLMQRAMPVFASGAGLFSDGYVNNVIGSVNTVLALQYGTVYTGSNASKFVSDIAFVGIVVGQLFFGFTSDYWSRSNSLLLTTLILVIFTALATGSFWHGEPVGMFSMLTAWRFFVGIGIGGEYPAGSVTCAEASSELKAGTRHRWFILFTNSMIDFGFVIGAFVPYVVAAICHNKHLETIWRVSLGFGVLFPVILFVLRLRLKEPEEYRTESMRKATPYMLVLRFYGFRLLCVSIVWFLYDFSVYAFGIYSSTILAGIYGDTAPLTTVFGWNTVINLFYIPGTLLGAIVIDHLGPKKTLLIGLCSQAIVGYIMAGVYDKISKHIAVFAVVYGIFQSLGEFGPGNAVGLFAAKTCATGVRGRYYGIAAAVGKIGAFIGTWVFPEIEKAGHNATQSAQFPFWVASSMALLSAAITFFFIPDVGQTSTQDENARFREFLEGEGWDTAQMGMDEGDAKPSFNESEQVREKGVL